MYDNRNFPYNEFPTGWFQVAWSAELEPGGVRPLTYFGQDLVLFRDEDGTARVFDAYCPHLGAHLGYGGKVCGDQIECPFHGWRWDGDGRNTEIPYSTRPNRSQQIRTWPVHEVNGLILTWHDPDGGAPTWQFPELPEVTSGDYYEPYPDMVRMWPARRLMPQLIAENAVDPAHQKYIHGASDVSEIEAFSAEATRFHCRHRVVYGRGKKSTWLTPEGEVVAYLDAEIYGMGIAIARFEGTDDSVHLQSQTPIDAETSDVRVTVLARREADHAELPERTLRRTEHQWRQVDNDLLVWEHMRYVQRPPLPPEEARPYLAFRRWAKQFYADARPEGRDVGEEIPAAL